jgi:hypothetical protein
MNGYFRKIVLIFALALVLIPSALPAEENEQTGPPQTYSQEELAQMLAPIALYPDALLSQILMAAAYPFEVAEADRWLTNNPFVTGDDLDEALQAKDWDVSVLALCHYPKVLAMMSENLSWTASLGDAFTYQEEEVMDTVQELRNRAYEAGNLATNDEQKVIVEERLIHIEPYSYDYFYVPAYDPYYVYGTWWLPLFPPFAIFFPGLFVSGPGIIYSPRIEVGFGVFGWSHFNWRARRIIITDIHKTRKFNRHYDRYRGKEYHRWRPDPGKRHWSEKRRGEIPGFRPPQTPPRDRWDRPRPDRGTKPGMRERAPERKKNIDKGKPPAIPRDTNNRPRWNRPRTQKEPKPSQSTSPAVGGAGPVPSVPGGGERRPPVAGAPTAPDRPGTPEAGRRGPLVPIMKKPEAPASGGAPTVQRPPVPERSTEPSHGRNVVRQPSVRIPQTEPGLSEGRALDGPGGGRHGEGVRPDRNAPARHQTRPPEGRGLGPEGQKAGRPGGSR